MLLNFVRLCSLLLLFAFFASSSIAQGKPLQYPDHAEATETTITVTVHWMSPAEVNKFCNGGTISKEYVFVGCYDPNTSTIYATQPKNFNDYDRLETLGHEFWHALGAEHP